MKRLMPLAIVLFLLFHAVPAHAATQAVAMTSGLKFDPATKTVNRGDKVMWTNKSFDAHNTSGSAPLNYWKSTTLSNNKTYTTPLALSAGSYPYSCTIHFGMKGTIKVPVGLTKMGPKITITLNTAAAPTGFKYVIQKQDGTTFKPLVTVTTASYVFNAPRSGTYSFRAALQRNNTTATAAFFSTPASITV